jgi:hypothetical protein
VQREGAASIPTLRPVQDQSLQLLDLICEHPFAIVSPNLSDQKRQPTSRWASIRRCYLRGARAQYCTRALACQYCAVLPLQLPVIHRRSLLVCPGAVGLGDVGVALDHGHVGMAEQVLQREEIAAIA